MTELQLYRDIATGVIGVLATILWWWIRQVADDMKQKLSREEFKSWADASAKTRDELVTSVLKSRDETRDTFIKLFEKMENHDKLDVSRFEGITKDFNGGINRLSEKIGDAQVNILTQLNSKVDK